MVRTTLAATAAAALVFSAAPGTAQDVHPTQLHDYRLTTVAEGLVNPWGMAFLPNGDMLVTERPGRLRVVRDGVLSDPVSGVPAVFAQGQGGLLDVALHPDFASNQTIYLSYSKPLADEQSTTAVIRGRFDGSALTDVEEIFEAQSQGRGHYGSRIQFDGQGHVFISVGERQASTRGDLEAHPAQDLTNHHGTVIRLNDDGSVPQDNPFVGHESALPEIWSYGHRNPQGMVYDAESGRLWATEHGPQGGDELNLIQPGLNYGWPVVGYGVNYGSGSRIHEGTMREGMENPSHIWVPSIATSGLIMYSGDAFPGWQGDLFSGGLSGEVLVRLEMDGDEVVLEEVILHDMGRIRDVEQGPDGALYIAVDSRRGGETPIMKLEPAN